MANDGSELPFGKLLVDSIIGANVENGSSKEVASNA